MVGAGNDIKKIVLTARSLNFSRNTLIRLELSFLFWLIQVMFV